MNRKITYHMFAMACAFIWGTTFLVSKMLLTSYSPIQIMIMRFFLAYIALWIIHPKWSLVWKDEIGFFCMSLFGNTLYYLGENSALLYTYSSNVSILVSAAPLITLILVLFIQKVNQHRKNDTENMNQSKKIHRNQVIGIVIAFLGMAFVVLNGHFVLHFSPIGDVLSLSAAFSWAFYSIILEQYTPRYSSMMISRKVMLYGLLQSLPIMLIQGQMTGKGFPVMEIFARPSYLIGILFLGMIGSAFCYIAWNTACAGLGVVAANMYIYTIPFVTLIAGFVVYHEAITAMALMGAVLIVLGMMISQKK